MLFAVDRIVAPSSAAIVGAAQRESLQTKPSK
jgi:hypothetical protein